MGEKQVFYGVIFMRIKHFFSSVAVLSLSTLFMGCLPEDAVTPGVPDNGYSYGPFNADYYLEDDGDSTGEGTDGSNPDIVPTLIASEVVAQPAINYIYADWHGIDSYNFYSVWEGPINVTGEAKTIDANFDVSWSDVTLYVDGELILKWSNSNKVIPLTLDVGTHSVRVEYHNHWHTTGFNVSFTDYQQTTVAEASTVLASLVDETTVIAYVGAYESANTYNEVTVTLPEQAEPILLFLSSYAAVNWIIDNPHGTAVAGIGFKSYGPGSTVSEASGAAVYNITDMSREYDTFATVSAEISSMTGREPGYTYGSYSLGEAIIPSI
ncbi:MAG: hypothetical protein HRU20_10175 [Pseudomonadales bacterium]|nr:hypothetical protein [Pseudomonadales bacterium]